MSLTKIAAQMSAMFEEREINDALNYVSSFAKEDQVKIAQFYEWLKEAEEVTKTATAEGKKVDVVGPFTNSQRLKIAVELAHLDELTNNKELMDKAAEASAAGALMSQVFNDYINEAEKMASEKKKSDPGEGVKEAERKEQRKQRNEDKMIAPLKKVLSDASKAKYDAGPAKEEREKAQQKKKIEQLQKTKAHQAALKNKAETKAKIQTEHAKSRTVGGNIKNVAGWVGKNKGKALMLGGVGALTAGARGAQAASAGFGLKKLLGKKEEEKSE